MNGHLKHTILEFLCGHKLQVESKILCPLHIKDYNFFGRGFEIILQKLHIFRWIFTRIWCFFIPTWIICRFLSVNLAKLNSNRRVNGAEKKKMFHGSVRGCCRKIDFSSFLLTVILIQAPDICVGDEKRRRMQRTEKNTDEEVKTCVCLGCWKSCYSENVSFVHFPIYSPNGFFLLVVHQEILSSVKNGRTLEKIKIFTIAFFLLEIMFVRLENWSLQKA